MKTANSRLKGNSGIPSIEKWHQMVKQRKPVPQLIQDVLADEKGEYGVIAGRTGIGKTNLSLHLAFCLATGSPFFGLRCEKVVVSFLAFEGDSINLGKRYRKLKKNFPPTERRLRFDMMPVQNPKQMFSEVFEKLSKTTDCRVVILDPIKYIVPGDYLKPQDVAAFIQKFKELLTACGVSAIITLPIKKPGPVQGLIHPADVYSIKGATEYVDAATSVLLVEKHAYTRSADEVTLHYAKHRIAVKELGFTNLRFNRKKCLFEPTEDMAETWENSN